MTRTDNDTWDLASGVGATATLVAAARAAASRDSDPLIADPYAEPLVRAVGVDFFIRMAVGNIPTLDDQTAVSITRMADNIAVRTKYIDDFFAQAGAAGIHQAVILASGLDSRAYRLPWPQGTVVYEIDQPEVIDFKSDTLAELGAEPTCQHRTVAIDLRNDWATALREAGFDPTAPTVWSAEGLLGYLPPEAQDRLLDTVTHLSAPGSRITIDCAPPASPKEHADSIEQMKKVSGHWREHGFDIDFSGLAYLGERNEASQYLSSHGWRIASTPINDLLADNGLTPFGDDEPMAKLCYISATLDGGR